MFKRKRKSSGHQIGCAFLLGTGFVLLLLFFFNHMVVRVLFSANLENYDERLFQAAQFLLPLGMLLVEYWFFDWMVASIRNLRSRHED